jgi:hypothetical protein
MILDNSEEVLPEACWDGCKEAASSVISVTPRLGQKRELFLSERNGSDKEQRSLF